MQNYQQLLQTQGGSEDYITRNIAYLAEHYHEYLPNLLETLRTGDKDEFEIAADVMRIIGYPANAEAVSYLLHDCWYGMTPSAHISKETVLHMPVEYIIPYFVELLWEQRSQPHWRDDAASAIYMLANEMDITGARQCLPVLCTLIVQNQCPHLGFTLQCLERVNREERAFAFPALLFLRDGEPDSATLSRVKKLIDTYDSAQLQPYGIVLQHEK